MAVLTKSLQARQSKLAATSHQLTLLETNAATRFSDKLRESNLYPLRPTALSVFQINLGKMCNQTCAHCHVDAGPDRREIMTPDTMHQCLSVLKNIEATTVDITGGAPELNPDFRWFVEQVRLLNKHIIVRCNLTIITANKKYNDLPVFYRDHQVEVISSLPFYTPDRTDRQRGEGVFNDSIQALKMLNDVGYGTTGTGLILNLVYNPSGAFLPANQNQLENDFKKELAGKYGITFNNLFCITNMPVSRYLEFLINSGNYERYMERLVNAYNPSAAAAVMCRNTISVGWDGSVYDCDFNQMLELKVNSTSNHISKFNAETLTNREIVVNQHCYGCTAGAGSGCGGATV